MKKAIILFVLVLVVFGFGITYSIFYSSARLSINDQNIAKFIFNAETSDYINLSVFDLNPGDKKEYLFSVSNNENGNTSEVTIEYQITIKTYHFIPFSIKLYKVDGEAEEFVSECDETYNRNNQNELVCNVPVQKMTYTSKSLDNYKLEIEFPSEYNDVAYSDLVDFINLEIKSWQKI